MRKMFASLFVVLAVLAMAVPASAQGRGISQRGSYPSAGYGYGRDQVSVLMNENMRMVGGCTGWYASEGCMEFRGGFWGQNRGGHFYGYYDNYRQRIGPRILDDVIVGGVVGIISGIIQGRMNRPPQQHQDPNVIVTPPYEQPPPPPQFPPQQQQGVRWGPDGIPVAVGTRPNMPGSGYRPMPVEPPQPVWKIFRNRFEGLEVRIHVVGGNPDEYISIPAGGEVSKELSSDVKIWAEVMAWKGNRQVPTQELGQRELPYNSGWVFFNPAKGEL